MQYPIIGERVTFSCNRKTASEATADGIVVGIAMDKLIVKYEILHNNKRRTVYKSLYPEHVWKEVSDKGF